MNKPEFFPAPRYGERQLSQAVKIGNRLETSSEGGSNDNWEFPESRTDEIAPALAMSSESCASAGAGWEHVIQVNSYRFGFPEEVHRLMTERFCHYMPDHAPIWTAFTFYLPGGTTLGSQ